MNKIVLTFLLGLAAGCSTTPNYDAHFGDAVREARMKMTLNPEAGNAAGPVAGLDGRAAREAVKRYEDSFKAPPPVTNVINIGGNIGSGGGGGSR